MILLSSPLKNDPLETTVSILFFLEIEIFTTKIVNSKSLKKICRQLLSTMNVLKKRGEGVDLLLWFRSITLVKHEEQKENFGLPNFDQKANR